MHDAVDLLLVERRRRASRRGFAAGLAAAGLLHALALAALALSPKPPPPPPLEYVAVKVVPLQALGEPRKPAVPPAPNPPSRPDPEPPRPEAPPDPEPPKPRPPPAPPKPEEKPAANPAQQPGASTEAAPAAGEREGSPLGSREGTTPFGATRLEGIDPEFTYDYYLDRMLAAIGAQWVRPPTEGDIRAVLRFTVDKTGEITDLAVAEPSGYPAFDLAALRAVQNASPLPRLPASYRKGALSVTLIVR